MPPAVVQGPDAVIGVQTAGVLVAAERVRVGRVVAGAGHGAGREPDAAVGVAGRQRAEVRLRAVARAGVGAGQRAVVRRHSRGSRERRSVGEHTRHRGADRGETGERVGRERRVRRLLTDPETDVPGAAAAGAGRAGVRRTDAGCLVGAGQGALATGVVDRGAVAAGAADAPLVPRRHLVGVTADAAREVDLTVHRVGHAVPGDAREGSLGLLVGLEGRVAGPARGVAAAAGVADLRLVRVRHGVRIVHVDRTRVGREPVAVDPEEVLVVGAARGHVEVDLTRDPVEVLTRIGARVRILGNPVAARVVAGVLVEVDQRSDGALEGRAAPGRADRDLAGHVLVAHEHGLFGVAQARAVVLGHRVVAAQALVAGAGAGEQRRVVGGGRRHHPGTRAAGSPGAVVERADDVVAVVVHHHDRADARRRVPQTVDLRLAARLVGRQRVVADARRPAVVRRHAGAAVVRFRRNATHSGRVSMPV